MVDIEFKVDFLPEFYNKLNSKALQQAERNLVEKLTLELEKECRKESPVRTGNLRDGHYTYIKGFESFVGNEVEYAPHVIFGTSKMSANNYPQRAMRTVITETYLRLLFEDYLRYNGIHTR